MSMFTLAISCLTTSSFPWFMDLTFQVPTKHCSLQHQTLLPSPVTSATGCCFCFGSASSFPLELFLHCTILGTYWPGEFIFHLFAVSHCSWGSQGQNTEVVCHSLLQWATFCQNSPPWPVRLGWPYTAWLMVSLNYTRLSSMWSVWLVFCDCGFHSNRLYNPWVGKIPLEKGKVTLSRILVCRTPWIV